MVMRTRVGSIIYMFVALLIDTAVTGMELLHTVRRFKLRTRRRSSCDQYHRHAGPPGKPGKFAGNSYEKLCPGNQIDTFLQRSLSGEIFRAKRNRVTEKAVFCYPLTVDTKHAVAETFQISHRIYPALGVVPVSALGSRLHGNTDIRFFRPVFPAPVRRKNSGPRFPVIHT